MADPTFSQFFAEVHDGRSPFPWQSRLAAGAVAGDWPGSIEVPTGMGKTSVIDAAVFALAVQADRAGTERTATTRVALIVDRRLVVDSAFNHAERLVEALERGSPGSACAWVRERLLSMNSLLDTEVGAPPLVAVRMRGGVTWAARWLRNPDQPAIILGTVDQFGSRLLFRGYGQSDRLKPIDAALVGNDLTCFIDEAHLSTALLETARDVASLERTAEFPVSRLLRVIPMSATSRNPGADISGTRLGLDESDLDSLAAVRLTAEKRAVLVALGDKNPKSQANSFAALARAVVAGGDHVAVGVVVNTVALARAVFDELHAAKLPCELVIGRCRPVDRTENEARWLPRTMVGRDRQQGSFVLVSTQTVEVGVDLDLDVLITQSAAIDALIQRFGRVDRVGTVGRTTSFVVRTGADDPVYGLAELTTWNALAERASVQIFDPKHVSDVLSAPSQIDFGPLVMNEWMQSVDPLPMMSPMPGNPLVTARTVACWRRTSPVPQPDDDVSPYLHGVGHWSPTVSVLWRSDLGDDPNHALALVPPESGEIVEVSLAALRGLLLGGPAEVSDLEGVEIRNDEPRSRSGPASEIERACVMRDGEWTWVDPYKVRPGDLAVLRSATGGHDRHGWTGRRDSTVIDVGGLTGTRSIRLRVDQSVLDPLTKSSWAELVNDLLGADAPGLAEQRVRLLNRLEAAAAAAAEAEDRIPYPLLLASVTSRLRDQGVWYEEFDESDKRTAAHLVRNVGRQNFDSVRDDGSDSTSRTTERGVVSLHQHLTSVGERAMSHADKIGLGGRLIAAVRLAGRFHDLGKAELRFQTLLHLGRRDRADLGRIDSATALAKSSRLAPSRERAIAGRNDWPAGLRHEAISLAMVQSAPSELFVDVDRMLVEHLVASHHGYARPLFPPVLDPSPTTVEVAFDGTVFTAVLDHRQNGLAHAGDFDVLCERYGTWGLALLESIVRLADMSISEEGS